MRNVRKLLLLKLCAESYAICPGQETGTTWDSPGLLRLLGGAGDREILGRDSMPWRCLRATSGRLLVCVVNV